MKRFVFCALNSAATIAFVARGVALAALITLAGNAAPAYARDAGVQVHGFATQGYSVTSANHFFGDSDDSGSLDFTEMGLNISARPANDLLATGQVLYRRAGNADDQFALDYALLDYRSFSSAKADFGGRIGRIKNPLGFYNDTRDVAVSRPSIILPQSIYFDRTRDLALSGDGIGVYGEHRSERMVLAMELNVIKPRVDTETLEPILLGAQRVGEFEDRPSMLGRIILDTMDEKLRFAFSIANLNIRYRAGEGDLSQSGDLLFSPRIFSAQYDTENFILTSEYARRRFTFEDIAYIPFSERTGESYYLQGQFKFNSCCWAVLRRDILYQDTKDHNGEKFSALTGGTRPAHSQYAKDWTLGLRWQPGENWLVSAEHHWVHGTAWLPIEDNPTSQETVEKWRMFLLLFSAWF